MENMPRLHPDDLKAITEMLWKMATANPATPLTPTAMAEQEQLELSFEQEPPAPTEQKGLVIAPHKLALAIIRKGKLVRWSAEKAGVTDTTLYNMLRGRNAGSSITITRLVKAFGAEILA